MAFSDEPLREHSPTPETGNAVSAREGSLFGGDMESCAMVPNPLIEILARTRLSPNEYAVTLAIIRLTMGWNKSSDWISLQQIASVTMISREHVSRVVKRLEERKVVTSTGNTLKRKLSINMAFDQWVGVASTGNVANTGNNHITDSLNASTKKKDINTMVVASAGNGCSLPRQHCGNRVDNSGPSEPILIRRLGDGRGAYRMGRQEWIDDIKPWDMDVVLPGEEVTECPTA